MENQEWHKLIGRGEHPTFIIETLFEGNKLDVGFPHKFTRIKRNKGDTMFDKKQYKECIQILRNILKKEGVSWFYNWINESRLINKVFIEISKNISKNENPRIEDLFAFFRIFDYAWQKSVYTPFYLSDALEEELKSCLNLPQEELKILSSPIKLTKTNLEKRDLLKMAIEKNTLSQDELKRRITEHKDKYCAIKTYFYSVKPYEENEIIAELDSITSPKEKITEIEKQEREDYDKFANLRNKLLDNELLELIELIKEVNFWRTERLEEYNYAIYLMSKVMTKIAKRFNLAYEEFIWLTRDEIISGKFDLAKLHERMQGLTIIIEGNNLIIMSGKDREVSEDSYSNITELKGTPSCKGYVKGEVCIASVYSWNKIKPGSILVTPETTPESTYFLKNVLAIVTDEGGITSHAAIVSRELNKPCITGTKIATKILKDGDLIEVDADKGIVRILKRAN